MVDPNQIIQTNYFMLTLNTKWTKQEKTESNSDLEQEEMCMWKFLDVWPDATV